MLTRWLFGIAVSFLMWFVPVVVVGQQNVLSRDDSGTGNWWDGANPWYYDDGINRQRPDDPSETRNDVFIGHDIYNPMNVNGAFFQLQSLTLESSITIDRIYNTVDDGGISLTDGLYNQSGQLQTFNVPIGVDASNVEFVADPGNLVFTQDFFLNANTAEFSGVGDIALTGVVSGTGGQIIKNGSGTLLLSGQNTYTGNTTVNSGAISLSGTATTNNTITGDFIINGGDVFYGNTADDQISNNAGISVNSGVLDFGARSETIGSLTLAGGTINKDGNAVTLTEPSTFIGGTFLFTTTSSRLNTSGDQIFGNTVFSFTNSGSSQIVLDLAGDITTTGAGVTSFTTTSGGSPGVNLNNAVRTFDVIGGTSIEMGWRLRSSTASAGGINKAGTGVMSINHTADYTGPTQVSDGVLRLGAADVIDNGSSLELNGGTLSTGETVGFDETLGTLNVQENSTIALGTGSHELNFAPSNGLAWNPGAVVTITGWTGSLGQPGTAGRIFVGTGENGLTQEQLNQIEFDGQGFAFLLPTGELVPRNPTFSVSETYLLPFSAPEGAPSDPAIFEVEGSSLTTDITINAPAGFEMSLDAGGPYSNPLTVLVTDLAGDLPATQIFTRLTGTTQGNFGGDLTVGTSGLSDQTVAVAGRVLTLGSSIIKFDDENWTAGTVGNLTTYATDHTYAEQDWLFTGGNARRFSASAGNQDGFPGAYGAYSWGLDQNAVSWTGTFTNSGTINAFGFKVRRWDDSPPPNYEVEYSVDGGVSFTPVETINNIFLNNSSQWVVFEHELSTPVSIGANDFVLRLSQTTGERIFIDDFSFDITPDACANTTWYYRSVASGSFTNKNSWEKSPNGLDSWIAADCPPSDQAVEAIIRNGHVLTLSTDLGLPDVIIEGNAELVISAGTIDLSAGNVTIETNGVLDFNGGEIPTFPTAGIRIFVEGTLKVSDGIGGISNALAGNESSGKVQFAHESTFEWNTTSSFATSNQAYFPEANAATIPTFYVPQNTGVVGASNTTTINGVLKVDGSLTWENAGEKHIRNGLLGNGSINQNSGSGLIQLLAPTVEVGGSGTLFLNNNGLLIPDGVTVNLSSDKPIENRAGESGKIEINGVLNDNGFGLPGDVDNVVIGPTAVINCTNPNGLVATNGTFGSTAGTYTIDSNSLVDYQRPGDQDITTVTDYGNLTIRGSGIKTISTGLTTVVGDVLLSETAVISAFPGAELSFSQNMNIAGTASFDNSAHEFLTLSTTGENDQTVNGNTNPFRCLNFISDKGAGSLVFNSVPAVEVKGEWNSNYYGTGDFVNNGATLQVGGDMRIRGGDVDRYSITGTIRLTGETGVSQVFRGTDDTSVSAVIENFIIGGTGNPDVDFTTNGNYTFTGDITIENGQLNAFNNQINLAGNWNNYDQAGFNENVARLFLNGSTDQVITCPGGEIFSSLTVNNSAGNIVLNDNLSVTGTGSEIIDLNGGAVIDLGGNTLSFSGNNGGSPSALLRVSDLNVIITGAPGSMFEVVNGDKEVLSLNSGTLEFDENVAVNAKSGIDFAPGGVSTIKGAFEIDAGGFVLTNPPIYSTGSILRYQSGGSYNRNAEWNRLAGEGLPHHIEITNSTDVFMSNEPVPAPGRLEIAGDLTIDDGKLYMGNNLTNGLDVKGGVSIVGIETDDGLYLGDNFGGDIRIGEDLVVSGSGALFQNTREVEMNGTGNAQTITGVDSFDYFAINNSGGTVVIGQETTIGQRLRLLDGNLNNLTQNIVMSDGSLIWRTAASATLGAEPTVVGGDQFNIEYSDNSFSTGNEFPAVNTAVANLSVTGPITTTLSGNRAFNGDLVLNGSNFNLNGNTLTVRGNAPTGDFAGKIVVDGTGTRRIQNTSATAAFFDITGMGGEDSEFYTKQVESLSTTSLVFEDNVTVRLGNGGVDFGNENPTTIEGVLEVSAGGFVINNSCYYAENSILRFANGFSYNVDADDKTWDSGDIASGNPGIPYNVESSGDALTNLTLSSQRSLRKNLSIDGSQFTLTEYSFEIGGNWNRSGASSAFDHNDQEVIFNGADPQTINTTDGVPSEVFYKLTFSGAGLKTLNEDVTVEDNITIDGTGGLNLNSQTIFLSGDWLNLGGETAFDETGRVELLGSEGQSISCTDGEKFDVLRVNNSSELSEGISLFNPIEITGELILNRGLIHNDLGPDITLTTTGITNGGDYRSYVTGKVVKNGFSSLDMVEFPVGYFDLNGGDTISVWQRAGLTPQTADGTVFSVQYFHQNAVPGTSFPSNPPEVISPLVAASTCNYWDISRPGGGTNAKVRLHWNDSTTCFDINDPAELDIAHLNSSSVWESQGVTALDSDSPYDIGYIESGFLGSFSPFTIGTSDGINVLPITLLDFSAEAKENTVDVRWTTSSEINNDFFTVERSLDAEHFEAIGTVDGAGNSNTPLYYHFSDDAPYSGISFYRLKQTDYDGTTTYSDIRMVRMDTDGSFELLKVFRAQDGLQLHYRSEVSLLDVEIIDLTGKRLYRKQIQNAGTTVIHPNLARGVYLLRINNGTEFKVGKFFY